MKLLFVNWLFCPARQPCDVCVCAHRNGSCTHTHCFDTLQCSSINVREHTSSWGHRVKPFMIYGCCAADIFARVVAADVYSMNWWCRSHTWPWHWLNSGARGVFVTWTYERTRGNEGSTLCWNYGECTYLYTAVLTSTTDTPSCRRASGRNRLQAHAINTWPHSVVTSLWRSSWEHEILKYG